MEYWRLTFWVNFAILVFGMVMAIWSLAIGQPLTALAATGIIGMSLAFACAVSSFLGTQDAMDELFHSHLIGRELPPDLPPTDEDGGLPAHLRN